MDASTYKHLNNIKKGKHVTAMSLHKKGQKFKAFSPHLQFRESGRTKKKK